MMGVRSNLHVGGRYRLHAAAMPFLLLFLLSTAGAIAPQRNIQEFQNTTNTTTSPTPVPTPTMSPTNSSSDKNNTTPGPTLAPTPHNSSNNTTTVSPSPTISPSPTMSPTSNATTLQPTTLQPTTLKPTTLSPTTLQPATPQPTVHTTPPTTLEPTTLSPTTPKKTKKKHLSIGRIIAKTIAYILIMILCVLLFGAIMSNRYRIYYALRGLWHIILQLNCTRWIRQKIRSGFRRSPSSGGSLNDTIFEPSNDMTEGLLLNGA